MSTISTIYDDLLKCRNLLLDGQAVKNVVEVGLKLLEAQTHRKVAMLARNRGQSRAQVQAAATLVWPSIESKMKSHLESLAHSNPDQVMAISAKVHHLIQEQALQMLDDVAAIQRAERAHFTRVQEGLIEWIRTTESLETLSQALETYMDQIRLLRRRRDDRDDR
jgi:dephospho-CoA kinase